MPEREIRYEQYQGYDIRSSPFDLERNGERGWKVRIDISDPLGPPRSREYLVEKPLYSTLAVAHTAGFQYGHHLIEEMIHSKRQAR